MDSGTISNERTVSELEGTPELPIGTQEALNEGFGQQLEFDLEPGQIEYLPPLEPEQEGIFIHMIGGGGSGGNIKSPHGGNGGPRFISPSPPVPLTHSKHTWSTEIPTIQAHVELVELRIKEGRCINCGELRPMSFRGMGDCKVCE